MPRSRGKVCPVCEHLWKLSEKHRPRVRRHAEERPGGWQRVTQQEYGGIGRLASGSMERMRRLYVREGGVNRAVGYTSATRTTLSSMPRSRPSPSWAIPGPPPDKDRSGGSGHSQWKARGSCGFLMRKRNPFPTPDNPIWLWV